MMDLGFYVSLRSNASSLDLVLGRIQSTFCLVRNSMCISDGTFPLECDRQDYSNVVNGSQAYQFLSRLQIDFLGSKTTYHNKI